MGVVRALLVGVCEYKNENENVATLPLCKNDLYALKEALIKGLNVNPGNIVLCGGGGIVTRNELISSIHSVLCDVSSEDTFIFYFSGHGGENSLLLSDGPIELQELINAVKEIEVKNKLVILDSCRSGSFSINEVPKLDINDAIESFAGCGYAVLASCGADQVSGFDASRQISLYTGFVCDALTSRFLIKKGKKSLESISESILHFAEISNQRGNNIQQPIFRANIGGTIFFDVEEYNHYKVANVYEETASYIIYAVEPVHTGNAKRLSVKVILRFQSSLIKIAEISNEIKNKVLYAEVHQNELAEAHFLGKAANIVWCYFGYDEDDIINSNFVCRSTWLDNLQDKSLWHCSTDNAIFTNNIYITSFESYQAMKKYNKNTINNIEFIKLRKTYTVQMISLAEIYIKTFREYVNNTLTEEELVDRLEPLNMIMLDAFRLQSDLPLSSKELHNWSHTNAKLSSTINDLSLFYNRNNLGKWDNKSRRLLMLDTIKRYEFDLEELSSVDNLIKDFYKE